MKHKFLVFFVVVLCAFIFDACSRLEDFQKSGKGELQTLKLTKLDSIPMEYGSLVGVTPNSKYPGLEELWFVDGQGTIRIVSVGLFDQKIHENVAVIPRQ